LLYNVASICIGVSSISSSRRHKRCAASAADTAIAAGSTTVEQQPWGCPTDVDPMVMDATNTAASLLGKLRTIATSKTVNHIWRHVQS